jgi:hypothetical protein
MAKIAIVTSTEFGGSNHECFQAGLTFSLGGKPQPTILEPFSQSLGNYERPYLRQLVRSAANNNPRPDLIVAVGGLEMAQAAASELQEQDPKFIFLSNDILEGNPVALAGGVNLNAPGADASRKTLLKTIDRNIQEWGMYLVVNNNSPIWRNDAKNWPLSRIARFFEDVSNPSPEARDPFTPEFDKLEQRDPKPVGLVISADPLFYYWRTSFTKAAEKLRIPVCYPFKDFVDVAKGNKDNKDNIAYLDKPPLNNSSDKDDETTAYFQLGKQVGKFITDAEDVGVLTWNGSEWKLLQRPAINTTIEVEIRVKGGVEETALQEVLAALRRHRV